MFIYEIQDVVTGGCDRELVSHTEGQHMAALQAIYKEDLARGYTGVSAFVNWLVAKRGFKKVKTIFVAYED